MAPSPPSKALLAARRSYAMRMAEAAALAESMSLLAPESVDGADLSADEIMPLAHNLIRFVQNHFDKPPEQFRGECGSLHLILSDNLTKNRIRHTLTFGNVIIEGKPIWNTSIESIRNEAEGRSSPKAPLELHAWLTFPDMTVLDLTLWLFLNWRQLPIDFCWEEAVLAVDPANLNLEYVPMIIGRQFGERLFSNQNLMK